MKKTDLDTLQLETSRLILRPPRMEDFDAWAAFLDDEVAITTDLYEVLRAFRCYRPSA